VAIVLEKEEREAQLHEEELEQKEAKKVCNPARRLAS
jgi:hypothetical protein